MIKVSLSCVAAAWIIAEAEGREYPLTSLKYGNTIRPDLLPDAVTALNVMAARLRQEYPSLPPLDVEKFRRAAPRFDYSEFDRLCTWHDSGVFGQACSRLHDAIAYGYSTEPLRDIKVDRILGSAISGGSLSPASREATQLLKAIGWPQFDILRTLNEAGDDAIDLQSIDSRLLPIPDHYVTKSMKFPGQVSFYDGPEKMELGRRTAMKPGRYLARFYPFLTPTEVAAYAAKLGKSAELKFAATPDDIVRVYTSGPSSCMSYGPERYMSSIHPVAVYGNSDLQLAYLVSEEGRITARALVWPEEKRCGRIYGDAQRLAPALQNAGYEEVTAFYTHNYDDFGGARIRRVLCERTGLVVCPYIDGAGVDDTGSDWLVISTSPDFDADRTDGFLEEAYNRRCSGSGIVHTFRDEDDADDEFVYVPNVGYCHTDWVEENCFYCDRMGEYYRLADGVTVVTGFFSGQETEGHRMTETIPSDCDYRICALSGDAYDEELVFPYWDGSTLCYAGPDILNDRGYRLLSDGDENFDPEVNYGDDYWVAPPFVDPNQLTLPLVA